MPHADVRIPPPVRYVFLALRHQFLPLTIVEGRRNGTPREDRICPLCRTPHVVADEVHLLFGCPILRAHQQRIWGALAARFVEFRAAFASGSWERCFRLLMCHPDDVSVRTLLADPRRASIYLWHVMDSVASLWWIRQQQVELRRMAHRS